MRAPGCLARQAAALRGGSGGTAPCALGEQPQPVEADDDGGLLAAVTSAFALQLAAVYLPPLRDLLTTAALSIPGFLLVTGLSILGYIAVHLDRRLHPGPTAG